MLQYYLTDIEYLFVSYLKPASNGDAVWWMLRGPGEGSPRGGSTRRTLASHFIHQFLVKSARLRGRAAACWAAGCKACGESDVGYRCLPRPPAVAVSRSWIVGGCFCIH